MDRKRLLLVGLLVLLLLVALGVWAPWATEEPGADRPERDRVADAGSRDGDAAPAEAGAAAAGTEEEQPSGEPEPPDGAPAPIVGSGEEDEKPVETGSADPGTAKPAVRRNPRDPPPPPPRSRPMGPGRGSGPRPTGLWEKFPPEIPSGRASVTVLVVDRDDVPVPGADVYLGPPDIAGEAAVSYAHLRKLGQTDAEGKVEAEKLPEGAAAIAGNLNGLLNGRRGLDATTAKTTVLEADRTASVTLTLPLALGEMGSIRGVIRGAEGQPARNAQVFAGFFRKRTDRAGSFEIRSLPAGAITLSVQLSGHRPVAEPVEIVAGETTEIEIDLEYRETGTVSLRGAVLGPDGEPVAEATVYVIVTSRGGGGTVRSARTDEGGLYAMESLPDRLYESSVRLQASKFGYRAANLVFEDGLTSNTVDFRLPLRMTKLRLTVTDAATKEIQTRCRLEANHAETGKRGASFSSRSATGVYETWIEAGTYDVLVETPGHEPHRATVEVPSEEIFDLAVAMRSEGDEAVEIALTVVVTATATGEPIETALVEVLRPTDGSPVARLQGRREGGRFRLPAPSGEWRVRVSADGFETAEEPIRLEPDEPEAEVAVSLR